MNQALPPLADIKAPLIMKDQAPALARYTEDVLFGDLWQRKELSPRDRSLVTVSGLIALYRLEQLPFHLQLALDNGVTRAELSEVITQLAFYAGWPNASSALTLLSQAKSSAEAT